MTTRTRLTLAALFGVSFAATLWLSGGLPTRAAVQEQPGLPSVDVATEYLTSSEQPARDWSAQATAAEEAPSREDQSPTLSQLTFDADPDTRSEAQTLLALLNEETADYSRY
jgi:hypothetical protein